MSKEGNSVPAIPDTSVMKAIESSILQSNYANAIEVCERLRESTEYANNSDILFLEARAYLGERDFQRSLKVINLGIANTDVENKIKSSQFYSLKAQALLYLGHLSESLDAANISIFLDQDGVGAYVIKGLALKHLYRDSEAIEAFIQGVEAVKHHPHERDVKLDIDKAFLARCCERYDLGIKYSNYVIKAAPSYSSGYTHLGYNLFAQYLMEKSADYSELADSSGVGFTPVAVTPLASPVPTSPSASDYFARAIAAFDRALSLNRNDSIATYYKGRLLEDTGDIPKALELYHQAASMSEGYVNPVLALVNIHMSRAEYAHALEHIETFLGANPVSEEVKLVKAKALVSADRLEEAQSTIESLIESNPTNYYYHYRKALVQYARKDVDNTETMKTCLKALEFKPDDLDVLYHQSLVFSSLGKYTESLNTIDKIIAINPKFAASYQAKGYVLSEIANKLRASNAPDDEIMATEEQSLTAHRHAISLDENNAMFYSSLASSLAKFHRIDGLREATEKASQLFASSSSKYLDPAQREFVRHQIEKKQELLSEVMKLINEAQDLHCAFESLTEHLEGSSERSPEDLGKGLAATSPQRAIAHQGSQRHLSGVSSIIPKDQSGFSTEREPGASETLAVRASHSDSVDSASTFAAVRRLSIESSTSNFMQPIKAGLHSRASDVSLDQVEVGASCAPSRRFSEDLGDAILAKAHRTRANSAAIVNEALKVASDPYVTQDQMNQVIAMLLKSQQESSELRVEVAQMRCGLSYALAHDAQLLAHEQDLEQIQSNKALLDYYSGFVNGFQKMFTGYMVRQSGLVVQADGFKIPFKTILPIPPLIAEGVSLLEAVANFALTTVENNAEIKALRSVPDTYGFLANFIPNLACRLATDRQKQIEISSLLEEPQGIFKEFYMKCKGFIYTPSNTSRYMELGASDALKLLKVFKSGSVSIDRLTDYSVIIENLVIQLTPRLEAVPEGTDTDEEEETSVGTNTEAQAASDHVTSQTARVLTEIPPLPLSQASQIGAGVQVSIPASSTRVAEPSAKQTHAPVVKHWYDCFCCCGAEAVSVVEATPLQTQSQGAATLAGVHNPVGDGADGTV